MKRLDRNKKQRLYNVIEWIKNTYGLTFFIAKMDAGMFEIAFYSVFNMIKSRRSWPMVVGNILGLVSIIYFIVQICM